MSTILKATTYTFTGGNLAERFGWYTVGNWKKNGVQTNDIPQSNGNDIIDIVIEAPGCILPTSPGVTFNSIIITSPLTNTLTINQGVILVCKKMEVIGSLYGLIGATLQVTEGPFEVSGYADLRNSRLGGISPTGAGQIVLPVKVPLSPWSIVVCFVLIGGFAIIGYRRNFVI
jgi:hypothetical protein